MQLKRLAMRVLALLGGSFLLADGATAQILTPSFQAPTPGRDVGLYLSTVRDDLTGIEAIYRTGAAPTGFELGIRGGVVIGDGGTALTVGAEYRNPLAIAAAPLRFAATAGAQALLGGTQGVGISGGATLGINLASGGLRFEPYVHPRLAFASGEGDTDLNLLVDLGVDLAATPQLAIRFAAGFGNENASDFGVGVAVRR